MSSAHATARLTPEAIEAARRAFDAAPADATLSLRLVLHHLADDEDAEVRRILSRHLDAASGLDALYQQIEGAALADRERAALLAQMAWLQAESLGDPGRGAALAREALAADPGNQAARDTQGRLARELSRREETAPRRIPTLLRQLLAEPPRSSAQPVVDQGIPTKAPDTTVDAVGFDRWDTRGAPTDASYDQTVKIPALGFRAPEPEAEQAAPASATIKQCESLLALPPAIALQALTAFASDAPRPADRALIHETAAKVHERAGDREAAFDAAMESARALTPERRLLDELFRLALLTGAYSDLAAIYEETLRARLTEADRVYLHLKLGHLYARELSRPLAAARHCRQALAVEPHNLEALRRMAELLGREGRWSDVVPVKLREIEAVWRTTSDLAQVVELKRELARIHEDRLSDREGALAQYREVLELVPDDDAAVSALERLAETATPTDPAAREAFALLEALHTARGTVSRLGELLSASARTALKANRVLEAVEAHRQAAKVFEEQVGDPARAFIDLVRAVQVLPQGEAAEADGLDAGVVERTTELLVGDLLRAGRAAGAHAQLTAIVEDLALRIRGDRGAGLLVRLAEIELEDLDDANRAASRLARAVELSGDDPALESRLEGLYVSRSAWRELASFYRARAGRIRDPNAQVEVLFRLAELLEDELDQADEAAQVYQQIIDVHGGDRQALEALCRLLEGAEDWAGLVATLERAVTGAADLGEKKAALLKRAEVLRARLRDPRRARADWQRVLALDPACVEALQGMADTAEKEADARETAVALEASLAGLRLGAQGRAEGYRQLARVYDDVLGEAARAVVAWEEVLREEALDPEAFTRLRAGYGRRGDLEKLSALLQTRLEQEPRHADVKAWRRQLVAALEQLGRADEVGREWRRALRHDPADTEALSHLTAFHTARQAWPEVEQTLRDWIQATIDRPTKAGLWARLGGVLRTEGSDEATVAYEKALSLDPDQAEAREGLIEHYRQAGAAAQLFPLLERRVRTLADPRERSAALRELWEVGRRLSAEGDEAAGRRATEALEEACLLSPEDDGLWRPLVNALSSPRSSGTLAGHLEARAARLEGARRAQALLDAAEAHRRSEVLIDARSRERARRCLERARDAAPPDHPVLVEILGMLRATYAADQAWEALAGILQELVEPQRTPDPRGRRALLEELAQVLEARLGRLDEAAAWLERAGELPGAEVDRFLERRVTLHGRLGDWPQVLRLIDERLRLRRGEPLELDLRLDAAEVAERRLDDVGAAVLHLRAALALRPGDPEILGRLERAALGGRRHAELAAILLEEAGRTAEPALRADLLIRAAAIEELQLGDLTGARRDLEAALALGVLAPDRRTEAVEALCRVLPALRAFTELAALHEARLEDVTAPAERAEVLLAAGLAWEQAPGEAARAASAFRSALEADGGCVPAMEALSRCAEHAGDLETAVATTRQQLALAGRDEVPTALLLRLGGLLEAQGDDEAAIAVYREAAGGSPDSVEPRRALLRLLRGRGDNRGVLDAARELAPLANDPAERATLWTEAGGLLEAEGNGPDARRAYEHALADHPGHTGASLALAALELAAGRPTEGLGLIEAAIGHLDPEHDPESLADARSRGAEAARAAGNAGSAERHLYEAARLRPRRPGTLLRLADLFSDSGELSRAHDLLRGLADDPDAAMSTDERAFTLRRLGLVLLAQERPAEAAEALGAALELAPRDTEALRGLSEVYARAGRFAEAIEVRQRLRNLSRDPAERRRLMLDIADVWAERLHDAGRAVRALGEALAEHPDDPDVLSRLAREQEKRGAHDEAADAIERLVGLSRDGDERARLYTRLGNIRRDRLETVEPALAAYRHALENGESPEEIEATLAAVRELAARRREPAHLARVLEWFADRRPTRPSEATLRRELAEVLRYQLTDRSGAIAALERVAALEPDDLKAAEDLARLYERQGQDSNAIARWRQVLEAAPFDPDGYRNLLRLFRRSRQDLGATVVASMLVLLEEADPDEEALARTLEASDGKLAPLQAEDRDRYLVHPAARGPVAELVAAVGGEGAALLAPSAWTLRRETSGPFTTEAGPQAQTIADGLLAAVRTLAIPAADVHVAVGDELRIFRAVPASRPLLAVSAAVLRGDRAIPASALRFHAGRALMGVLPAWWPARVLGLQDLKNLLEAALHVAGVRCGDREVERLARRLERVLPPERAGALASTARAYAEAPEGPDLRAFVEGVEHTAVRAGLLLAGSPEAAIKALRLEGEVSRTVLREAVRFAISSEHLALRARLRPASEPA